MPTTPNLQLEINEKNEITRIHRGRASVIARMDKATIIWKDEACQSTFRASVNAFLDSEAIKHDSELLEGQRPDVVPENAPPAPKQHLMQGEMTPAHLEWLEKWKPIAFQNLLGVQVRPLKQGEKMPENPRDLWVRADVIRTDVRPTEESHGGQYISTKFKMKNQIIARRPSHLTFTPMEIFKGDDPAQQAEPFTDPYADLKRLDKEGKIEIVSVKNAAASAGSIY